MSAVWMQVGALRWKLCFRILLRMGFAIYSIVYLGVGK